MKIYNGYERLPRNYTLLSDEYEFTMSNGYLNNNKQAQEAVFDLFFRTIPNGGAYSIMAGIDKVIPYIQNLKFGERELDYFKRKGYSNEFINYLKKFKFTGNIYAIPDGTPVFPNEPLMTVKAPIIEAQIIETALLSIVNGAKEHATGARRIIEATPKGVGVMEFGSRRADGCEAAIDSAIYGIMAGCIGTSNVLAAYMLNITAMGTQAHSWIESYDSEYESFLAYAKTYPKDCFLLVDTIDTLKSGVPNAIRVAKEYLLPNGYRLKGIRIDSGDLAYLSKEARKMLDEAGLYDAGICLSNGLTAESIEKLVEQKASFTSLGVGDNISKPNGRMGCVYKEVALTENGILVPKIKLSNDVIKITNPGYKNLYRAYDKNSGLAIADVITGYNEEIRKAELMVIDPRNNLKTSILNNFELLELQKPIFINGELVYYDPEILKKQKYCDDQMTTIDYKVKKTELPDQYFVGTTENYINFKNNIIEETQKLVRTK